MSTWGITSIFPNLSSLRAHAHNLQRAYLSPSIREMTLWINKDVRSREKESVQAKIDLIWLHSPNIEVLYVDGDSRLFEFRDDLCRLFEHLPRLRRVVLAPCAVSSSVLATFAKMRNLESICVAEAGRSRGEKVVGLARAGDMLLPSKITAEMFESLRDFSFISPSFPEALRYFSVDLGFPCQNLVSLWVHFPTGTTLAPADVRELLCVLSGSCRRVKCLTLRLAALSLDAISNADSFPQLQFGHIEPFLTFTSLMEFAVDHTLPLDLSLRDMRRIARRAVGFSRLWLNPFPSIPLEPGTPICCLEEFSRSCPLLERLALYVDGSRGWTSSPDPVERSAVKEFFVGWSSVPLLLDEGFLENRESLAILFSHVFSSWTAVTSILDYGGISSTAMVRAEMRSCGIVGQAKRRYVKEQAMGWKVITALAQSLRQRRRVLNSSSGVL